MTDTPLERRFDQLQQRLAVMSALTGADVNAANALGHTPLMFAADCGYITIARILLHGGADPSAISSHGLTAHDVARNRGFRRIARTLQPQYA
jgi:ankyrin repeat protein